MSWRQGTVGLIALTVLGLGYLAYVWHSIPDAYAAWDAGTLIVEYLETHDDEWPRSWDDLLSATASLEEHGRRLRGSDGEAGFVYGDLQNSVAVDWNADVETIAKFDWDEGKLRVVTRANGKPFQVVWGGADPNVMVWKYMNGQRVD